LNKLNLKTTPMKTKLIFSALLATLLFFSLHSANAQKEKKPTSYQSSSAWAGLDTITEVFANIFLTRDSAGGLKSRFPIVDEYESENLLTKTMVYQFETDDNYFIILKYGIFLFKNDCILETTHECFVFKKGNSANRKTSGLKKTVFTCHLEDGVTNASQFYMPFYSDPKKEKLEVDEGKVFVKSDEFGNWHFIRAIIEANKRIAQFNQKTAIR